MLCLNNGFTMLNLLQVLQSNIEELVARAAVDSFALLCADDTERRRTGCPWLARIIHDGLLRNGVGARDKREERDSCDV